MQIKNILLLFNNLTFASNDYAWDSNELYNMSINYIYIYIYK